jgi:tetratricopeptide (TPR) repeat protein
MPKDTQKSRKSSAPKPQQRPGAARALDASAARALQALLDHLPTLSQQLRQSSERAAISQALSSIDQQPATIALAFAEALGTRRETDAADVALALAELSQHQALRKEARKALVRLRSAGIAPHFSVPASEAATPQRQRPFYLGYVSRTREQGEVQLALAWYENQAAGDVRGLVFLLEFWRDGVKDFLMTDVTTTRRFQQDFSKNSRSGEQVDILPISLAQARQLVQEALEINTWRKTPLPDAYKRHYATIRDLLLNASVSDEEEQAVLREGDRPWISRSLEPEELIAHALGAWAFGDYGLFYDLLADEHSSRRAQTRDEFIQLRRQWADEADPASLRVLLIREQAEGQSQSSLWVPTGIRAGGRKEVEAFWSLLLKDSPLGGQMEELPMATIINRETGRHWYWTGYTLAQQNGVWRISRQRDEGLLAQGAPIPDLQQRVKDLTEEASRIAQSRPATETEAEEATRKLFGAVVTSLHSSDALIARLPLDRALYDQAALDARSIGQYERAAAYYQRMLDRFSDRARLLTQLGIMQYLAGERDQQEGNEKGARRWWESASASLEEALSLSPTADTYQALAELRLRANRLEEAEQLIRQALELDDTRAERWGQLGSIQMNRSEPAAALESFKQAAQRSPDLPGIQFHIGRAYRALGDRENARLAYEEAIRRNPNDTEAYNNLAALLEEQEPARAIELVERAVALAPNVALYHANLAALLLKTKAVKRGKAELELAERLDPSNPIVRQVRAFAKSLNV